MKHRSSLLLALGGGALVLLFTGTASLLLADDRGGANGPAQAALDTITAEELLKHTTVLASDEYEGRGPGSKGEELSVQYITEQFKKLGLQPGNPDGTYIQEVPLAGIRSFPTAHFTVAGKEPITVQFPGDYVATSARLLPEVKVEESDIVFVGYGVVAPEYGWDDYKDVDVRGKTILMLINDPPVPDPHDPAKLDETMFKGAAMTYYGRWTYKYEIAAQKGAAAAVIVHETGPAAYPYSVVEMSWARENFEIDAPDKNMGMVPVRSWITLATAQKLVAASGLDFETLKKQAVSRDFKPVALPGAQANFDIKQRVRPFKSRNVVAKIDGSDPKLKDEWIIYSAHWDHLGKHPELQGDQIFNGALDNASGVAALLALAKAHAHLPQPTKRSALFLATTAEESGLLGAKFYAEHPLHPLTKTLADINIDVVNPWGKTHDVEDISWGNSTLDDLLIAEAAREGREAKPNSQPEKGGFYRADHFEFSKLGVPSLYLGGGREVIGKPANFGQEKRDDFVAHHYHQPSDEVDPTWDLSGAAEDTQLLFRIGCEVANGDRFPEWKPGTEFKAKRDAMMSGK
ncbi:MAG: M28 family peptidase [Verrucomicrobia bacterium]|nr:M28 family peptidase [Verrucomicrobiota bacterium]